jgi:hypothetical protein
VQRFGQRTAKTEQHHRPELRIAKKAHHQLPLTGDLGLHQQTLQIGTRRLGDSGGRTPDSCSIMQVKVNQPSFRFVLQRRAQAFEHNRIAESLGRRHSPVGIGGHGFTHDRYIVLPQQLLGLMLVEGGRNSRIQRCFGTHANSFQSHQSHNTCTQRHSNDLHQLSEFKISAIKISEINFAGFKISELVGRCSPVVTALAP